MPRRRSGQATGGQTAGSPRSSIFTLHSKNQADGKQGVKASPSYRKPTPTLEILEQKDIFQAAEHRRQTSFPGTDGGGRGGSGGLLLLLLLCNGKRRGTSARGAPVTHIDIYIRAGERNIRELQLLYMPVT